MVNLQHSLANIKDNWAAPGVHIIVTDPTTTGAFWQQVRTKQSACTLTLAPNTIAACAGWYGQLSQSFLGQQGVYWIQTPSPWAPKSKKEVIAFINTYQGPHALWVVCDEDMAQLFTGGMLKKYIVSGQVPFKELGTIVDLLDVPRAVRSLQQAGVMRMTGSLSLDVACSVVNHAQYVPMRMPETATAYLSRLMPHDGSLLNLSTLFFSHQWERFLPAWERIASSYSDMFWVAFWTEQCWRAYWVTHYSKQGQVARARSMSFRLPTLFAQKLWQKQTPEKLLALYQRLSFFDTRVKNGSLFTLNEIITSTMNATRVQ